MSTITTQDGTEIYYKDWGSGPVTASVDRAGGEWAVAERPHWSGMFNRERKAMNPIAYITVTDHKGTVLKRVSVANRDVQDEIDMVGSSFRDRGGLDPFHMVIRSFDDDLAKAMETAWSQAT